MKVTATADGEVAILLSVEEAKACQFNPTTHEFRFFIGDRIFSEAFHMARISAEIALRGGFTSTGSNRENDMEKESTK